MIIPARFFLTSGDGGDWVLMPVHGRFLNFTKIPMKACNGPLVAVFAVVLSLIFGQVRVQAQTRPLVSGVVDNSTRTVLSGNVPLFARYSADSGPVEDSFPVGRMYLILKRSSEQENALGQFLRDAHTPGNASYLKWLTPEEFGKRFGAADSDIAAVTAWLESDGLVVTKINAGRIAIEFTGTAGQIKNAFHTEIHRYQVLSDGKSETQYANASEPEIPAALAAVVAGVSSMRSRHAHSLTKVRAKVSLDMKTHALAPDWTYPSTAAGTAFVLGPGDFAVQYDIGSVYKAGITGSGESIGILSYSNVDLSLVQAYQALFGLPANLPTVVVDGNDPGENDDATEANLDIEQSGAIAPGSQVVVYTSAGSILTDPLLTSGLRAVEDNLVSVISVSAGMCEAELGAAGNAAWAELWQEAAAQGITVFVAAGDSGSAGCDDSETEEFAESGLAVNGLGSTPYNVSVGGTDFYFSDYAANPGTLQNQIGTYWSPTPSKTPTTSLLQPVPEQVWNDAFGLNAGDGGVYDSASSTITAGGGGVSSAALYPIAGPVTGYPKPSWQIGAGVPNDSVRDVPDISLFAGDGSNRGLYPICAEPGDCVNLTGTGTVQITTVGGTSAAAAAMAGIQALVDQATESRQGQANYVYYALANKPLSKKPFRDISVGGNEVPCFAATSGCFAATSGPAKGNYAGSGYAAAVGYDPASGLGSVDVANLILNWTAGAFESTSTTLSVAPTTIVHGTPVKVMATVTSGSGTDIPTGSVALTTTDPVAYSGGLGVFPLSAGEVDSSFGKLPGGTYQLIGEYSGDSTYGPSSSMPVTVTVAPEKTNLNTSVWVVNPVDGNVYPIQPGMLIPYGSAVYLDVVPTGANEMKSSPGQATAATGAITFNDQFGTTSQQATIPLNSVGVAEWIPGSLAVGSHVIGVTYPGDASYNGSTLSGAATLTVFKGTATISIQPMETNVTAGSNVTVDLLLASDYLALSGALPTGTIAVTLGSQTQTVASPFKSWSIPGGSVQEAIVTFSKVPAGILPLSASYSGDSNWNGSASLFGSVESLAAKPAPVVTLAAAAISYAPNQTVKLTGTVTGTNAIGAPIGVVSITWEDGSSSTGATLQGASANSAAWTLTFPAWQMAKGANAFVATFKGDSNYSAQSSAPLFLTLNGSDFSLITTSQEVEISPGNSAEGTIVISQVNSYSGTVAITCSSPVGISCSAAVATSSVGSGVSDAITFNAAGNLAAGTYPAMITATGGGHTHTAQILVDCVPATSAPEFIPAPGTYLDEQTVTVSDATRGAIVYYTTDGSVPTASFAAYTGPITVKSTGTLRAIAIAPKYSLSGVATGSYTISPVPATPAFSVASGTYISTQTVSISDATDGVSIYYTLNGTTPTAESTIYTGPVLIKSSGTLEAIAVAKGGTPSKVASASYTLNAAAPEISPPGGRYPGLVTVTMSSASPNATIFYTTNGSTPTAESARYTGPIVLHSSETVTAIAAETGFTASRSVEATYIMEPIAEPPGSPVNPVSASVR